MPTSRRSPYDGLPVERWYEKTQQLVREHPLPPDVLVDAVLHAWDLIHGSVIGGHITIGEDYFPTPQILGDFLHELIPFDLSQYDSNFRKGITKTEKDITCDYDDHFSIEIKTSSQKDIYGNRSYAQKSQRRPRATKDKSGYYLAINFPPVHKSEEWEPISQIRFGWLDAEDWQGQASQTGQQASLSRDVLQNKLITLYEDR